MGGGRSDTSPSPSPCRSGLGRWVFCLRLVLKAVSEFSPSMRGLKERGRGGSGGTGALYDGTRCGIFLCGGERVERLRRGASYGWRGRGTCASVGPLTYGRDEGELDFSCRFGRSSSFIGPLCRPFDPILEFLSNHEAANPPPANEWSDERDTEPTM